MNDLGISCEAYVSQSRLGGSSFLALVIALLSLQRGAPLFLLQCMVWNMISIQAPGAFLPPEKNLSSSQPRKRVPGFFFPSFIFLSRPAISRSDKDTPKICLFVSISLLLNSQ